MARSSIIFRQVFSAKLDSSTAWYALTTENCIGSPRKASLSSFFRVFPNEISKIKLCDLVTRDGSTVQSCWFFHENANKVRVDEVYVATAFGIIGNLFNRRQITEVNTILHPKIQAAIRSIDLEDSILPPEVVPPKVIPPNVIPPKVIPPSSKYTSSSLSYAEQHSLPFFNESFEEVENSEVTGRVKRRKTRAKSNFIMKKVSDLCSSQKESLASVLARCCTDDPQSRPSFARETICQVMDEVAEKKGVKRAFEELISDDLWDQRVAEMRMPDWQLLFLKVQAKISDANWQSIINFTKLGRKGSSNICILPIKNHMKALRSSIFGVAKQIMLIREVPDSLPGYQVSLEQAIVWSAREQRLHGTQSEVLEFHLKLDGRPLFGKDQVSVGIVPGNHPYLSSQSALTVRPLAIANIEESRKEIKVLVRDINRQKDVIKRNGIVVDGKLLQVKFKVIIDYKAFCLLLCKKDDENFRLGGKGFGEFCMFCHALRLCAECNLGSHQVCLKHFAMTKANIGGFTGIRDDLTLLLDENMTAVNICALHCELRNMEQLLASLGLFCHKIGSLAECNAALKEYGPQTMKKDRIRISTKPGQETMVEKHNVKVASFSGPTERKFLQNSTVIVERSLPLPKLKEHFRDVEAAKLFVLNKITFYQERVLYFQALKDNEKFVRDFGTHQEEINIKDQAVGKRIDELLKSWKEKVDDVSNKFTEALKHNTSSRKKPKKKKRLQAYEENDVLGTLAADLALECYIKVFSGWNDIALVMRKKLFKKDEEHLIDLFDIQCKEWGFLLREVFGLKLGTGDYGHMAIEHASMLLRNHRSIGAMSTQGFESSHKVHRQLYLRATSHDVSEGISSIDQILTHQYAEYFLFLRLSFRKALECLNKSSAFHFSGCYWSLKLGSEKKKMWTSEDIWWMSQMDSLLTLIFGVDYPRYAYQKAKSPSGSVRNGACIVQEEDVPSYKYVHNEWEKSYQQRLQEYKSQYASPQNPGQSPSQHAAPPSPVSRQSSSQHAAPPPPVSTTTLSSTNPLELLCRNPGLTRGQLASLNIPPVAYIKDSDITLVQNIQCNNLKDPFSLICRPSEAVVDRALKLLRDHVHSGGIIGADDNHSFVSLGTFGTFTGEALEVIKSFCFAAEIKQKVREELTWLGREDSVVRETLLSLRPQEEFLNVNGFLMDAKDLSNLACERYVDGYTIDMSCMLFLKKSIHASSIAYLPSHTFTWATADHEFLLKKLTPIISFQSTSKLEKVICPVHVGGCHWGILCLDFSQEIAYYDDGMHMEPPTNISAAVTKIMKVLTCLRPSMSSILWSGGKVPFQRFGMPKQPSSGEGSSSCGIGVIFAARDIIEYRRPGIPSFSWSFSDSSKLRKRIINEPISARIHASGQ